MLLIFSVNTIIPLKDKKGITITNAFQKILNELKRKPNKIWVDKRSEYHNRPMKSWLEKMRKKCIQHIMKKNLLLLKDLLEHSRITFISICLQYQKMYILIN